jgi:putative redox protein
MIASAEWKQGRVFAGRSASGHAITIDGTREHTSGPSPMEMVLTALCACTAVDVVSILEKKREPLTGLTVSATAEQPDEAPRVFTRIHLNYRVHGKVAKKAGEDAVALSKTKYCSVSLMLEKAVKIDYSIEYAD